MEWLRRVGFLLLGVIVGCFGTAQLVANSVSRRHDRDMERVAEIRRELIRAEKRNKELAADLKDCKMECANLEAIIKGANYIFFKAEAEKPLIAKQLYGEDCPENGVAEDEVKP